MNTCRVCVDELLDAYDGQLRAEGELPGALTIDRIGPLLVADYGGGRGFVTYRDLGSADATGIDELVRAALQHFGENPAITDVEWKTRGHDRAPGLSESLLRNGFVAEESESVMIGEIAELDIDAPLPLGVSLRRVDSDDDLAAIARHGGAIFSDTPEQVERQYRAYRRRRDLGDGIQFWVAEHDGEIVTSGRLEPLPGDFAGIWGGGTSPEWRGQGIYRALVAARASAARQLGKTLLHSDSTEDSRPILERAGMVKVTTTTPYQWHSGR